MKPVRGAEKKDDRITEESPQSREGGIDFIQVALIGVGAVCALAMIWIFLHFVFRVL
jgi:hypothetical protein